MQKVAGPGSGTAPPTRGHCSFFQCLPQNESDRLPRASVAAHSPWTPAAFCPFLRDQPSPGGQAAPRPVHRTRSLPSEFLLDLQAIPGTLGYSSAYLHVHYFVSGENLSLVILGPSFCFSFVFGHPRGGGSEPYGAPSAGLYESVPTRLPARAVRAAREVVCGRHNPTDGRFSWASLWRNRFSSLISGPSQLPPPCPIHCCTWSSDVHPAPGAGRICLMWFQEHYSQKL